MASTAYTPSSGQYSTYASQVKIGDGQSLHYQQGKGYYAGPAPVKPPAAPSPPGFEGGTVPAGGGGAFKPSVKTPAPKNVTPKGAPPPLPPAPPDPYAPLTPEQIDAQATAQATAALSPQQAEIQRQAQAAKDQAAADEAAITGFRTAAGTLLAGIAPKVSAGYTAAEQEQGQLGQGMATGVQQDLAAAAAKDQSFAESQGQTGGTTVDPNAVHDVVYGLNGQIPGESLGAQGAAATALAAEQPAISLAAGQEELSARMAQAHKDNDGFAQQLISLAATFPGLKTQALQQLNQYELDKANYRRQLFDSETQRRAEVANEKLAGIKQGNINREFAYKWAGLAFKEQQSALKVQQSGKTIDVGASKLLGHIVYKDGTQDPSVHVAMSGTPTAQARQKVISQASETAFKESTALFGKPVANKTKSALTPGVYLAAPGAKGPGVYPAKGVLPATTDNAALAVRASGAANYQDALTKVMASISGRGLSVAQQTRIAKQMLKAAGWKPGR